MEERKSGTEISNDDFKDFNSPSAGPPGMAGQ